MNNVTYDDYLEHYGVKGMKWGRRKSNRNENYSDDQMRRDSQVYGKRGAKRINSNMNKGDSVSTARSVEKTRRDTVKNKAVDIRGRTELSRKVKQAAGGAVGAAAGGAGAGKAMAGIGKLATSNVGQRALTKLTRDPIASAKLGATVSALTSNAEYRKYAAVGGAAVGGMVGARAPRTASTAYVRAKGYNPNRL